MLPYWWLRSRAQSLCSTLSGFILFYTIANCANRKVHSRVWSMLTAKHLIITRQRPASNRIIPQFCLFILIFHPSQSHWLYLPSINAMASLRLVLIAAVVICFCQFPANASKKRPRALVTQITKDPATLRYTFQIRQRTPLRIKRLVLDIEQDYMWVRCDKKSYRSSTYKPVACSAQLCKSYQYSGCGTCYGPKAPGCNNNTCVVPGLGSDSFELAQDVIALPSSDGSNPGPLAKFRRLAFACAPKGDLVGLPNGTAGVAGMSPSNLALPYQLSAAAGFDRKFAICLPGGNAPGALFFGDGPIIFLPPPGRNLSAQLIQTPLIKNAVYTDVFYIGVQSIEVNGAQVPIDAAKLRIGAQGRGGTRLSTVVPYTQLATAIYNSLVSVFTTQRNLTRVASVAPFDACFDSSGVGSTRVGPAVPSIDLVLQGNATIWRIFGANSLVAVNDKVLCLGFVDAGDDPVTSIVIGAYQMQDNLLQFDLATSTLGFTSSLLFTQTTCSNFNFTSSA